MYTVKRFEKGDTFNEVETSQGTACKAATARCYAVVDENGKVPFERSPLTGKAMFEVYSQKATAQQQADFMNR